MIRICKGNTLPIVSNFTSKVTSSDYLKFRHNYQPCLTGQKYNQKKEHSLWRTPKAHSARYTNVSVFKFQCICFLDSWINLTCNWNLTQGFHSKRENKINSQSWFFWTLHQGGILFSFCLNRGTLIHTWVQYECPIIFRRWSKSSAIHH